MMKKISIFALFVAILLQPASAAYYYSVAQGSSLDVNGNYVHITYVDATHFTYQYSVRGLVSGAGGYGVWLYGSPGYNQGYTGSAYFDVSPVGTATSQVVTVTTTAGAWFNMAVRLSGENGDTTDTVMYYQHTAPSGPPKQMTWAIPANASTQQVIWAVIKIADGSVVVQASQPAGANGFDLTATNLPSNAQASDYRLDFWLASLKFDSQGGTWYSTNTTPTVSGVPNATTGETRFTATPTTAPTSSNVITSGTTPTAGQKIAVPAPSIAPTAVPTAAGTGGGVWRTAPGSAGLSDSVFREGVDKLYDPLSGIAKGLADAKGTDPNGNSITSAQNGAGNKAAVQSAFSIFGSGSAASAGNLDTGSTAPFSLNILGRTLNFDPAQDSRVAVVMAWMKAMIAWVLTAWWAYWVFSHFRELTSVGAVSQIRGHNAFAGTGGAAMALGNAVLWTAIVLTIPAAFAAAMSSSGLDMPSLSHVLNVPMSQLNAAGNAAAVGLKLVSYMIPWANVVIVIVGPPIVSAFSIPIYMGVQYAVRWLIA